MNKFILPIVFLLGYLLMSCQKQEENKPTENSEILLLKVDFSTNKFEGGSKLTFPKKASSNILVDYKEPGDFGGVQLYFNQKDQKIFDGTIIWNGKGERMFPTTLMSVDKFKFQKDPVSQEGLEFNFLDVDGNPTRPIVDESIWAAIDKLEIVAEYHKSNPEGKVNIMLYQPSVGVGDPADWDWYVILAK